MFKVPGYRVFVLNDFGRLDRKTEYLVCISIAHLWNRDILNDSINIPAAWPIYSDVYNIVDNIAVFLVCRCGNVWIQQIHPPQAMATAVVSTSPLHHVRLNVSSTEDWH